MRLTGAMTALVTPFTTDDRFDERAAKLILKQQLDGGISGLVVGGTTGESPTITEEEKQRYTELALEAAAGKVPVIVGTGSRAFVQGGVIEGPAPELVFETIEV